MKILLVGEYYSKNLGDPVLCGTVRRIIEQEYPDAIVVPFDMSGKMGYNSYFEPQKYNAYQKWFFRIDFRFPWLSKRIDLFQAYKKDVSRHMRVISMLDEVMDTHTFDLVLFAGGSIFMD